MIITRLRLQNFRQHADTELRLGPGLTGVIGPNGSGKSTLLEAIAFAMYGVPAVRGNRDSIRRRNAEPRAPVLVELDFALGAHTFKVTRSLTKAELFQDGGTQPIANSLATVTERVTHLLGMIREEFFNTYFTGQKELAVMADLSGPARADFLNRVLGYERLRSAQDLLKEERTGLRSRIVTLEQSLPDPAVLDVEEQAAVVQLNGSEAESKSADAALQEADTRVAEARPRWDAVQSLRERVVSLEADLKLAEHKAADARERFGALDKQMAAALSAQTKLAELEPRLAPLPALKTELEQLDQLAEKARLRMGAVSALQEVRKQRAGIDRKLSELATEATFGEANDRVLTLNTERLALQQQAEELRAGWVRDRQDAESKIQALLDQHQDLADQRARLETTGEEGDCPTCGRPLGGVHEHVLGVLSRQMESVIGNGTYYRQRQAQLKAEPPELTELDARIQELERELGLAIGLRGKRETELHQRPGLEEEGRKIDQRVAELEATIAGPEMAYDLDRHRAVREEVRALEPLALDAARLREAAGRAESLVQEAHAADQASSALEADVRARKGELESLGFSAAGFASAKEAKEAAERAQLEAQRRLDRARLGWDAALAERRRVQQKREERVMREGEVKAARRELLLREELDRAFTDLRADLNAQLRPELSEIGSGFLRDLSRGRYSDLELDEDYRVALLEDGEVKPVISGGEEDIVNLALRLAISQMIADRAGQPLSLLVLDEVFGSLDEERRAAVIELLRGLGDRFPQVILITHVEHLREGFDRVVRVSYDVKDGIARVADDLGADGDGLAA
ncbi:MAG: SMC family ATPase [Gemmatimonadales bacterium]